MTARTNKTIDPFVKAPEFLAAYNNILSNGFFEQLKLDVWGQEGQIWKCYIESHGCIPDIPKYMKPGIGAVIDPQTIISACQSICSKNKVKRVEVSVKTSEWKGVRSKGDTEFVYLKGSETRLDITIYFHVKL